MRAGRVAAAITRRGDGLERASELALAGVTMAAIVGMHLLFTDGTFFPPLVIQALIAHVTLGLLRRMDVRLGAAACIAGVVAVLSITWLQYLDTTVALLPSQDTLTTIRHQIGDAWGLFQDVRAPAPVVPGFIATTSMAVWVIVFIADWGAFRTGVSFEALLPPATLFLFAAVLGEPGGARVPGAALFVATALVFLLVHRTWRQEGAATWAAVSRERSRWSMLSSGAVLAALPVLASAVIGPRLPGAGDPPVVPWQQLTDEEQPRVVISPLVDIRSRLVDQADVEVFTVQTEDPVNGPYWRLTALDTYEDGIWGSSYDTDRADGELPPAVEADTQTTQVVQTITIEALDAIWLPAAHEPVALDLSGSDIEVDYDRDSETLTVSRDTPTSDGLTYTVTSEVPTWTAAQLRSAPTEIPEAIRDRYLQLPRDFSPRIRDLAAQWTAGTTTQYDAAMALQTQLRRFPYDQSVQPGHSEDALEDFLFVNRRGYCEQFAGAFAAMARSLDIPARVAVGFTKGTQDQHEPRLWRVTGRQAHAWVEVYFQGLGWVTFDPTPGRAPSGAAAWLGIDDAQDTRGTDAGNGSPQQPGAPTAPGGGQPQPGTRTGAGNVDTRDPEGGSSTPRADGNGRSLGAVLWSATLWLGLAALIYAVLVPLAQLGVRALRRLRARSPAEQVGLAWREASDAAADAGIRLAESLTVAERAQRLRGEFTDQAREVDLVAGWVEAVNYAEVAPTAEQARAAVEAAGVIADAAARTRPGYVRLLRYLDIRRLLPQPEQARRSARGAVRTA